ncbi:metal-dependent hydrolase [Desulfonatronovibrio hydrogenovorans]|uniref:metal-dependent hydrolase n=1 Tax=Desulfonatronovibrio hydrogenovorans TaxID=53245 RepID=UPI000490073E|nr:metal-dependent hydrolase [Desulfonatronovibrio hydrogenovorans]
MANQLIWHGHANFEIITPDLNIFIDPWFTGNPSAQTSSASVKKADLVLVTHDHADHLGQAVEICKNTGAHLGAIVELAGRCKAQGVRPDQILNGIGFNIGGTVEFKGVQVTMTQAEHSSDQGVCVGFILTLENGFCIYHAGDTGIFATMGLWGELYQIDLAILPTGGVFTMDSRQAALACRLLKCRQVVPMHWGSFPVLEQDTQSFARELTQRAPETELISMEPGQKISL